MCRTLRWLYLPRTHWRRIRCRLTLCSHRATQPTSVHSRRPLLNLASTRASIHPQASHRRSARVLGRLSLVRFEPHPSATRTPIIPHLRARVVGSIRLDAVSAGANGDACTSAAFMLDAAVHRCYR